MINEGKLNDRKEKITNKNIKNIKFGREHS